MVAIIKYKYCNILVLLPAIVIGMTVPVWCIINTLFRQ